MVKGAACESEFVGEKRRFVGKKFMGGIPCCVEDAAEPYTLATSQGTNGLFFERNAQFDCRFHRGVFGIGHGVEGVVVVAEGSGSSS